MRTTSFKPFLTIVTFAVFFFSALFTYSHASSDDENIITGIFEMHGKNNVVNFLLQKRDGEITVQKNRSFVNVKGRPALKFITAKSVNHDLKNLNMDAGSLEPQLVTFIENESKKQQKKNSSLSKSFSAGADNDIPSSRKIKYKIQRVESNLRKTDDEYEKKRLRSDLSSLKRKYKDAKYKEKYKSGSDASVRSTKNKKYNGNVRYCASYKSKLQNLTKSAFRYQVFYCNDRAYRAKNAKSCDKYKYSRQYSIQEYKDEISKLRREVSKYCK